MEALSVRSALAWLGHPVTLAAIVLLAFNDHVLKAAWPGTLTGKLSDVAGLVVAPALLAVVVTLLAPRLARDTVAIAALASTAVGFALVKLSLAGAAVASAAWSAVSGPSVVLADVSDLVALPAVGVAGVVWRRVRDHPVSPRAVRMFRVAVVLPVAVLAVGATSAVVHPEGVEVTEWRGAIVVGAIGIPQRISEDHGRTWRTLSQGEEDSIRADSSTLVRSRKLACVPDEPARCYRVVPGHLRVEETGDGGSTWSLSWEVPDGRRPYLARSYPDVGKFDEHLSSVALVVHRVPGGGHVVVVANGRDGFAVRDENGRWDRVGFTGGRVSPVTGSGFLVAPELMGALAVALIVAGVGACLVGLRSGRLWWLVVLALAPSGALCLWAGWTEPAESSLSWAGTLMFGALVVGAGAVPLLVVAGGSARPGTIRLLVAIGLVTGVGAALPFVGWSVGRPDSHTTATVLAAVAALTGCAVSAVVGYRRAYHRHADGAATTLSGRRPAA